MPSRVNKTRESELSGQQSTRLGVSWGTASWPQVLLICAAISVSVLAAWPVLTHPVPPSADYANHLARLHILHLSADGA